MQAPCDTRGRWQPVPVPGRRFRLLIPTPTAGPDAALLLYQNEDGVCIDYPDGMNGMWADRDAAAVIGDALSRFARHGDLRPPTSVCSVRGLTAAQIQERGVTYVGRPHGRVNPATGALQVSLPGHPLANPYRLAKGAGRPARLEAVARYREWLRDPENPHRRAEARALRGRVLGCWCGEWDGIGTPTVCCHAVEIALLAEEV